MSGKETHWHSLQCRPTPQFNKSKNIHLTQCGQSLSVSSLAYGGKKTNNDYSEFFSISKSESV